MMLHLLLCDKQHKGIMHKEERRQRWPRKKRIAQIVKGGFFVLLVKFLARPASEQERL